MGLLKDKEDSMEQNTGTDISECSMDVQYDERSSGALTAHSLPDLALCLSSHPHDNDLGVATEQSRLLDQSEGQTFVQSQLPPAPRVGLPSISTLALPTMCLSPSKTTCLLPDAKSETNSALIPICRICQQPEDGPDQLLSPCRCAGTLQYIHNSCLVRWLEIMTKKSRKAPKCELCHYPYNRHKKFNFSRWRCPRVSRQDKVLHVIFIINMVVMIGCAAATIMCFLSDKGQITKFPRNRTELTTSEIITLSCGVLFFVSFFIAMSVQIKAKYTVYQLFVKFILQNMEWEIDEYDKAKDSLYATKLDKNKSALFDKKPIYRPPMSYV